MIDLQILEDYGLTHENLKSWFDEDPKTFSALPLKQQEAITQLRNHIRNRVQWGRDWNLANHQIYHALDLAWDAPFKQVSPTLIASLMGAEVGDDKSDVAKKLTGWGIDLSQVVEDVPDPKVKGKSIRRVNVPAFFQVFVPLVRAYVTIRWAKIINDRRLVPFFKFEPAIDTKQNRLKCDVITSRIELMSRQIGYFEVMKQSVFQMLHYGVCLQFPVEEWYSEEQFVRDLAGENQPKAPAAEDQTTETVSTVDGKVSTTSTETENAKRKIKTKKIVVKEGIRYHMPHPTRMFWDQAHRISTFNSDTGCEFAGYWRIMRFRDIYTNTAFWNRDLIPLGTGAWWDKAYTYFQTVYKCTLNFPSPGGTSAAGTEGSTKDREANLENRFYSGVNNLDHTVMLTEYFEKLVPKEHGLGDYPHPVWFRFVVCGDTGTVIYAAPLPYCPVVAYAYDADELREQNASLSLECLPFQDQFSNLLTQYLLTVQHNLTNLTMIDKDQVEDTIIDKIENSWAGRWVRRTIVRFSGRKSMKAQQSVPNAAVSIGFQALDSNGIIQAMKIVLDTLERVLVMSSQEVAQAASHEQTREEVRHIAQQQSTRLQFSTTPVDLAGEAWKRQLYGGLMAYGSPEFYAQVPFETPLDKKIIESLGFTFSDDKETDEERLLHRKVRVNVKDKTAISLDSFASTRDGEDRINNIESAVAMATFVRDIVAGPYGAALGPDQFIALSNEIARLAGFPRDFKLVNKMPKEMVPGSAEHAAAAKDQLMQMVQAVEAQVVPKVFDTLKQPLNELQGGIKESLEMDVGQSEAIKAITSTLEHLQAALGVSPMPPSPMGPQNVPSTTNASLNETAQPGAPSGPPTLVGA